MIYADGKSVELGDEVHLGGDQEGVVVGIIDEGSYADGYRKEDWACLGCGLIVSTGFGDLRLDGPNKDLELVARPDPRVRFG